MKTTVRFSCHNCGQHFEAPAETSGNPVNCPCGASFPTPKESRLPLALSLMAMLLLALVMLNAMRISSTLHLSPPSLWDIEKEAESDMLKECSNTVGFVRIVDHRMDADWSKPETAWTGNATVDFVNKVGGVERTNLLFDVWKLNGHGRVVLDYAAMHNRDRSGMASVR